MTKRVNWLPNERVDIPDLTDGTTTLVTGTSKQNFDQTILNNFAAIMSGFRVEIANQVLNPGQFTIYNGISFDRSGQLVYNEEEENAQRSFTLIADGQYFVEVEFALNETNSDARGFWDPTVSNGNDPSGDIRMPGREFPQTVATRLTPDWQIVLPISGTDFQINTNPNSLRIPIAALQRVAGVIAGLTSFSAKTCLAAHYVALSSTQIKVLDSRIFPDTFTATVGATAVTVSANDRVNNILTLSAVLVANHAVGERIAITTVGAAQFLAEATPLTLPIAGSLDARPRYWQGNEERGYALAQDPYTATGRSDVSLQTLKDEVDFLTSQLREMRFGAERAADLGKLAPPATFATPRYFDKSGGLQGARCSTVSIGDGVTSWGDFNVSAFATAQATFSAAIAAIPSTGGTLFIKRSAVPYALTTGINLGLGKPIVVIGENSSVEVKATAAAAAFTLTFGNHSFTNVRITRDAAATATYALAVSSGASLYMNHCHVDGMNAATALAVSGQFDTCTFNSTTGGGTTGIAVNAHFKNAIFSNCTFTTSVNAAASRCVSINPVTTGIDSLTFQNCEFTGLSAMTYIAELNNTGSTLNNIKFDSCTFVGTGAADARTAIGAFTSATRVTARDCVTDSVGTFLFGSSITYADVCGCKITNSKIGIDFLSSSDVHVDKCVITHTGTTLGQFGVRMDNCSQYAVSGCSFSGFNDVGAGRIAGVHITNVTYYGDITNNKFYNIGSGLISSVDVSAIAIGPDGASTTNFLTVSGNTVDGVFAATPATANGIHVGNQNVGCKITGNNIININNSAGTAALSHGIKISLGCNDCVIANNIITLIGNGVIISATGIIFSGTNITDLVCTGNTINTLVGLISTGIFMQSQVDKVVISNNQVSNHVSTFGIGIAVLGSGASFVRRVTVNGNVLEDYNTGIQVNGGTSANDTTIVVSGNSLTNNAAPCNGILVRSATDITVSGNSVRNFSTSAVQFKLNISIDTCSIVSVTGNTLQRTESVDSPGAIVSSSGNLHIINCVDVLVASNKIHEVSPTTSNWVGLLIDGGSYISWMANMITKQEVPLSGGGRSVAFFNAPTFRDGRAFKYGSVYPNDPLAFNEIDLNWMSDV